MKTQSIWITVIATFIGRFAIADEGDIHRAAAIGNIAAAKQLLKKGAKLRIWVPPSTAKRPTTSTPPLAMKTDSVGKILIENS